MSSGDGNVSVSYTWDSLNRLITVADSRLGTTTYTYDTASNVITVAYPNDVQSTLNYDQLNRLTSLTTSSTNTGYLYQLGPTGNRTNATEITGRCSINWSFDGIYRLTNETITNAPSKANGSVSYGLDPVGNLTGGSGNVLSSYLYDPFGQVMSSGGDSYTYTGLEQDLENGTIHAGARNLALAEGRWLRPDPDDGSYDLNNPQSFNRYSYVGNMPMSFTDPSGLDGGLRYEL